MSITDEMYDAIVGCICSDIENNETALDVGEISALGMWCGEDEFDGDTISIPVGFDTDSLEDADMSLTDLINRIAIDLYKMGYHSVRVDDSDTDLCDNPPVFRVILDADEAYEINKKFISD